MPKQIRVSDDVYKMLLDLQRTRETFSELIARLLKIYRLMEGVLPLIREQREYFDREVEKAIAEKAAHG